VGATLEEMATLRTPTPRANFVADLEARLSELMQATVAGDVLPDVELAPPAPPASLRSRVHDHAPLAVAVMLAIALLTSTVVGGDVVLPRELRTATDTTGPDNADGGDAGTRPPDDGADNRRSSGDDRAAVVVAESGPSNSAVAARRDRGGLGAAARVPDAGVGSATAAAPSPPASRDDAATTKSPPPELRRQALTLQVTGTSARAYLEWGTYTGPDFAAYLVLRANDDAVPEYPDSSGRTLMLLRIENPDMVRHEDTPKLGTVPTYRIVVVDAAGRELARSPAVKLADPIMRSSAGLGGLDHL
jgi:hypothetical protein